MQLSFTLVIICSFILVDELFAKVLRSFETCVLVNKNLYGKLFSSVESPTTFDESFKVTSAPVFIPGLNLLRFKLNNFTFIVLYTESFYIDIILKQNKTTILSQLLVKNLKWFLLLLL